MKEWRIFYNREKIKLGIRDDKNMKFLKRFGYNENMNIHECLSLLRKRFQNMCPHEIGIFLGYPIEDVVSFVDFSSTKCKMVGYWKVYHDIEKAEVIFNKYDERYETNRAIKYKYIRFSRHLSA